MLSHLAALAGMTQASRPAFARLTTLAASGEARTLPGDIIVRDHSFVVPTYHSAGPKAKFGTIELYVREVCTASATSELPYLLFLQGGPGFPSPRPSCPPSGWLKAALAKYHVLLLDQRGTWRSSACTPESLALIGDATAQAEYLAHFRADAIVKDCEVVRKKLAGGKQLSLLGQAFGGFCILSYLSQYPKAIERAIFTCGLAPVGRSAVEVYQATYARMEERNRRFYARYPQDVVAVRAIMQRLHAAPLALPRGGTLTPRRFLQLGLLLGSGAGLESLHNLLEGAASWHPQREARTERDYTDHHRVREGGPYRFSEQTGQTTRPRAPLCVPLTPHASARRARRRRARAGARGGASADFLALGGGDAAGDGEPLV